MGLLDVPNEIILLMIPYLEYEGEINALCRTTRWLHDLLNPILYKRSTNQQNGGYTLEWAAINGSVSTAKLILGAGAPPDACGRYEWQPFALAALHGNIEIIELLYQYGVDPCSSDNDWRNPDFLDDEGRGHPLSMAASNGNSSAVSLLLEYGVHPDLPTGGWGNPTPLHLAAEGNHLEVVRILTDAWCQINAQGLGTSLRMASCSGDINIVQCLLDHGATLSPQYSDGHEHLYPLCRAAILRHDDIVGFLLNRSDYIESSIESLQQASLLCVVARAGRITLLSNLLSKHKFDPVCLQAVTNPPIFSLLLSYNANPTQSSFDDSLLDHVLTSGNIDTLRILLDHPRVTELVTGSQRAKIFRGALRDGERVFRMALDRGLLDPPKDLQDHAASEYLAVAAGHGNISLLRLLLEMGFNSSSGHGVAHLLMESAIAGEDPDGLLDFLLQHGCSINDTDPLGQTALVMAAFDHGEDVLRRLLERGADPWVFGRKWTPLSLAAWRTDVGAVQALLEALDKKELDLDQLRKEIQKAQEFAREGFTLDEDEQDQASMIVRMLHRFYWLKRYPVPA